MTIKAQETPYWWVRLCFLEESQPALLEKFLEANTLRQHLDETAQAMIQRIIVLMERGSTREEAEDVALREIVITPAPVLHTDSAQLSLEMKQRLERFKAEP